jgi:hypothetical protein
MEEDNALVVAVAVGFSELLLLPVVELETSSMVLDDTTAADGRPLLSLRLLLPDLVILPVFRLGDTGLVDLFVPGDDLVEGDDDDDDDDESGAVLLLLLLVVIFDLTLALLLLLLLLTDGREEAMDRIKSPNKLRDNAAAPEGRRLSDVLLAPIVDRVSRRRKWGEVVDTYVELVDLSKMIVDWPIIEEASFMLSDFVIVFELIDGRLVVDFVSSSISLSTFSPSVVMTGECGGKLADAVVDEVVVFTLVCDMLLCFRVLEGPLN